jgi:hypothetical protein
MTKEKSINRMNEGCGVLSDLPNTFAVKKMEGKKTKRLRKI